jgi:predicted MPP superfamily phosphohydrolase
MKNTNKLSRRDFLKLIKSVIPSAIGLGLIGYLYGSEIEMDWIETSYVTLKLPRLDPAFHKMRLVQISDFHVGHWMDKERLDYVLKLALAKAPECFILTGDFVDKYPNKMSVEESIAVLSESFSQLSAFCPTFAVLGNHDHLTNPSAVQESLASAGVEMLRNSVTTFKRNGRELHIAGVDDVREKADRFDQVLTKLPEGGNNLLLVHEPDFADTVAATGQFDAQFSGHSHGGQLSIPFIGPPYLPSWGRKYPQGLYSIGNMLLYTNRGVGVTSINLRFNCRPEITVFTLETG